MPIKFIEEEDQAPTVGEKAKAIAYGAATGFVGGPGELEKFGAYDVPEIVGARQKGERDTLGGRETIFPTIEEAQRGLKKVGIEKPREEVSGYQTVGELVGGLGTSIPRLLRGGARVLLGAPTKTGEAVARKAEKLGFKLSPAQVRADVPVTARGATGYSEANQKLANELASTGTGAKAAEISSEFIGNRLTKLGSEYDKVYKGKEFRVDPSVQQSLQNLLDYEQSLGVAGVSTVKQAAQTIIEKLQTQGSKIAGDDLQRLRNAVTDRARSTSSRGNAHEMYDFVKEIDDAVAVNNPAFKQTLGELNPKYRNTIILEDLYRNGGIKQGNISLEQLGTMLRGKRDVARRTAQDIDELGEIGRELGLRARWETVGRGTTAGEDVLGKALGTGADIAGTLTGTRTVPARAVQRFYAGRPTPQPLTRLPEAVAAGTLARPLQEEK